MKWSSLAYFCRCVTNTGLQFQIENLKTERCMAANTIVLVTTCTKHRTVFWPYLLMGDELGNETDISSPCVLSNVYYTNFHLDRDRGFYDEFSARMLVFF